MEPVNQKISFYSKASGFVSSKVFVIVISFLGLYLLSSGIFLAVFSYFGAKEETPGPLTRVGVEQKRLKISLDAPKVEECPINGAKFTKAEREIWEKRRPVTVILENHADSRPPSGVSRADVVYEVVAEGGITRFLGVFYCGVVAEEVKVAPVRSARIYFIDYAAEYGDKPIFMHVGGANNYSGSGDTTRDARALEALEVMGWRVAKGNDFDTTYDSGFPVFWRNYERLGRPLATEHTMMASLDAAYEEAERRGLGAKDSKGNLWSETFRPWKFSDDNPQGTQVTNISFKFWDARPEYDVEWRYDATNNQYARFNAGVEHVDFENKNQHTAKNVVILFAKEKGPVDRNLHMVYTTTGKGSALIFQNGQVIQGSWSKEARKEKTKFFDKGGREITFVRGPIWVEIVPAGNEVDYK